MISEKLSSRKSIDVKLPAIGTGRRSRQRFKVRLQFVGSSGSASRSLPLSHDRTPVIRGVDVELRTFFLHVDLFLLHVDVEH